MKKRAPIKQLLEAGEEARKKLVERGILSSENIVARTAKEYPKLVLPGIPSYIPHKWTIKSSQRIMYDLFKMWQFNCKDKKKAENLTLFIEFAITEMNHQEEVAQKKMKTQEGMLKYITKVPVLGKIFEPVNQYETIRGIKKFFVDSFAVALMVNGHTTTTGGFANFFFTWTDDLYKIWESKDDKTKNTRV
jgi:hypothetical protein